MNNVYNLGKKKKKHSDNEYENLTDFSAVYCRFTTAFFFLDEKTKRIGSIINKIEMVMVVKNFKMKIAEIFQG